MQQRVVTRLSKSVSCTLPAPLKGLNVRDSLADMDVGFAIVMDNYIPLDTRVMLRPGYTEYIKTTDKVRTLCEYIKGNTHRFLAVIGNKIYNISSRTAPAAYDGITLTEGYCQTAQYKNYLYFVNGVDVPKAYYIDDEGVEHMANWGFSATNLEPEKIVNVSVSKQRLWFVEKNTLRVWYPETAGNISGTLQCFDLAQVCRFGGHLVAVANWTQDGGQGIDDLTVFITSEGEALVYSGDNVNSATDWKLRGSFKINRPIGYLCVVSFQGDVVIISEDGYVPLSKALPMEQANASQFSFSDNIRGLILDRTAKYSNSNGWQGLIYGRRGYGIFNVPVAGQFEQHVINTSTGAWCRWTDIRSLCWGLFNGRLYFGSDAGVFLFDEGWSDNGVAISGAVAQAYNDLGITSLKKILLLNPRTRSSSPFALVIYTNMDMEERSIEYEESIGSSGLTKWNKAKWSSLIEPSGAKWSTSNGNLIRSQWIANSSTGYKVSLVFKTKTRGTSIEWFETGIRFQRGEGVL